MTVFRQFRAGSCAPIALALLVCLAPASAAAQTPAVTLDEAIRLAQHAQPSVVQAQGSARNARAQVRSAKGAYLPSLNASTSGSRDYSESPTANSSSGSVQSGSTNNLNFGLSSSIDLFTGFRRGSDSRAAKATRTAADASLTDAESQAALTATQQFFDVLAAQQLVRVREASVTQAEEQLKLSVAKLHVGSATRSDSLRSLVNLGTAQLALVSAQSSVAATQATLGRTLGLDGRVAATDDSAYYSFAVAVDTAELQQEALANSPSVQAAAASAAAAHAQLSSAKAAYWPTLALSGSANWSGSDRTANDYQLFARRSLSLGLSWPIFNKFQREQTIVTRSSSADAADATAADTRRQVQAAVTTQAAALEAAKVRIAITKTSVEAAGEDLRVVQERYRVGAATILDVLTSQSALAQAQVDAVNARFDYLKAKAQIEALIGRHL
jgi:outer membrane protein TolC